MSPHPNLNHNQDRVWRVLLVCITFVLAFATPLAAVEQPDIKDGFTPPGLEPGSPVGSYVLSGFDTVNYFNGSLNFALPLLEVGGRGLAGYPALNNESFTVIWVGKLEVTGGWETLVSMAGGGHNFNLIHKDAVTRRAGLNTDEGSAHDSIALQNKVVFLAVRCDSGVCEWREGSTGAWDSEALGSDTATSPEFLVGASIFSGVYGDASPSITHSLVWAYSKSLSDAETTQNFNFADGEITARGDSLEGSGN
jgi:hypothetical protein